MGKHTFVLRKKLSEEKNAHNGAENLWSSSSSCMMTKCIVTWIWRPAKHSLYVEWDVQVLWNLLDPNVTDEIRPGTTTFLLNSTYHVAAVALTRQPQHSVLHRGMNQQEVSMAPYCRTTMMQQDLIYWTCDLLSSVVSCASIHYSGACNKQLAVMYNHINLQWIHKIKMPVINHCLQAATYHQDFNHLNFCYVEG